MSLVWKSFARGFIILWHFSRTQTATHETSVEHVLTCVYAAVQGIPCEDISMTMANYRAPLLPGPVRLESMASIQETCFVHGLKRTLRIEDVEALGWYRTTG